LWQDCGRALVSPLPPRPAWLDPLRECNVASFADLNAPSDRQSSSLQNLLPDMASWDALCQETEASESRKHSAR